MDDSDQDFVDLCSKLLKRVRKKPGEPRQPRKAERQPSSQASNVGKRKRNHKRDGDSASKCAGTQPIHAGTGAEQQGVCGGAGCDSGDAGRAESGLTAKDKVLQRMQQFKWTSPQRMVHRDKNMTANHDGDCAPLPSLEQNQDTPESFGLCPHLEPKDSDEALAQRLQQELDREAAQAQVVDLEDGGLFFCHICHRDLTHMSPEGRTQHVNRCLDESEERAPAPPPPPPPPGVPDCPICGKKFKSQKSRSAHLKRCSSDMGVSPAVLLQALQRQAEETQDVPAANRLIETGGTKRKGPSKPGVAAKRKPRKKPEVLDEDTMVALALSSSLQEQDREPESALQLETAASHGSMAPMLKWRKESGKGRGKRKKGAVPRPPPLLLVQDAEAALTRLQERVSALLLRTRAPSPPTPPLSPSSLSGWSGAAPLWQKSALLDGASARLFDFYAPELRGFFTPCESTMTNAASSCTSNESESSVQPASEGTPVSRTRVSIVPFSSQAAAPTPAPSTPQTGQLPVSSQAFRDLMDLAEDGMTSTQYNLHQSGFVQDGSEEQAELGASGFLPEMPPAPSDRHSPTRWTRDQPAAEARQGSRRSEALSKLASDLSGMVNNPQLSDVQLQVDSGEVYFAHSFMAYARCPLLAEMVHESGFGVQEEGMPSAQRVLISDVPGQAVFVLLQYLYTAHCSIPAPLRPHVLELASRFDLKELEQLCELRQEDDATQGDDANCTDQEESVDHQTDQAFIELLRSMWNDEEEDHEATDTEGHKEDGGVEEHRPADDFTAGDREISEEKVNEEELEEIYEFALTQRKREEEEDSIEEEKNSMEEDVVEEKDSLEEDVVEEKDSLEEVEEELKGPERSSAGFSIKTLQTNLHKERDPSPNCSYSRLFSDTWGDYVDEDPPSSSSQSKTHTLQSQKPHLAHQPLSKGTDRALLQSSQSTVDNLTPGTPPSTSALPVPGQSPGQGQDWRTDVVGLDLPEEGLFVDRESPGPRSICISLSPDSPQQKKEPELIVLSDSSVDLDTVGSSRSPSPHSPYVVQNQSYTHIKPQEVLKPKELTSEDKQSGSSEFSPGHPSAGPIQRCDRSPLDCSPELSWLIPSTPLQHKQGTMSSSSQTRSSMCRTQLFPKGDASSSSSSAFSPPALLLNKRLQASNSPIRVSAHVGPAEDGVPVFAVPLSQAKPSRLSSSALSNQDTAVRPPQQPYSSTPLHTPLHQPPGPQFNSPLHSNLDKESSASQERGKTPPESPEKMELGSFHLSPFSDPSDPLSSSSHRALQSSQNHSDSPHQSRRSVGFNACNGSGKGRDTDDGGQHEEATEETGATESSFRQSFMDMDEPPMAFSYLWDHDVCVDPNPGRFSLQLEDSRSSGQHSHGQHETARSSSSNCQPSPPRNHTVSVSSENCSAGISPKTKAHDSHPSTNARAHTGSSPHDPTTGVTPGISNSLLDSNIWDSWEEEEEGEVLPLSQRVKPSAQHKTPELSHNKRRRTLVPITPMPHYSDMDTPELKNKLNRFGVRPLPKRQMILKLREIHHYTHQLVSSDSEDEAPLASRKAQVKPSVGNSLATGNRPQTVKFKEPRAPAAASPLKHNTEEEAEPLSASQGSNTSSTAASEESERSNPELGLSSDGDSDTDGSISASQAVNRLQDRLRAVRSFILSDSDLYTQILQYKPLVLSQLQEQLKAAGIRLGAAKLVDYLDSQCITFTTAKPGHSAPNSRRGRRPGKRQKVAEDAGASRKRDVTAVH